MATFPRHGWEQGGKGRQRRAKLPPRTGDALLGMTAVTKPQPVPTGCLGGKRRSQQGRAPSAGTDPLTPPLPARSTPRSAHRRRSSGRVGAQPQHSPASEPTTTHARITGSTTFAASARRGPTGSAARPNLTPTYTLQAKTCCRAGTLGGGTGQEATFWGAISPVSFPGHREETLTHSGRGAGRRSRSG